MKLTNFPIALALVATIAAASVLIPVGDPVVPYRDVPASATDSREGRVDAAAAEAEMLMGVIEREKLTQPPADRLCQDLYGESVNGNFDAFEVFQEHCPRSPGDLSRYAERYVSNLPSPPQPVRARVTLDTVQVEKAQDCAGLRAKAYDRDPVAAYDLVQLQKAGLCVR